MPIAVFASGSGTNLQRLLDVERSDASWPASIRLVVSDKPGCLAVERARRAGVPVFAHSPREYPDKPAFERAVLAALREHGIEWVVLAGYMRIVGETLLGAYEGRMLNIHPSLLPHFPGRQAVRDALAAGVAETGVTVHFVDAGVDTGPIVAQERVAIDPGMTEEELLERIHAVEHELYPRVIRQLLSRPGQACGVAQTQMETEASKVGKWALVSVFDKEGVAELCQELVKLGYGILSTGGTARHLAEAGVPVTPVEEYTGFPEMLDGRVKTLHPRIHGGLLGLRDNPEHVRQMHEHGIADIDLVVVNLYPFRRTAEDPAASFEDVVEMIDIGGPSLLRAAAKNHRHCIPLVDPADYGWVLDALRSGRGLSQDERVYLAAKVFAATAQYDQCISEYLAARCHVPWSGDTGSARAPSAAAAVPAKGVMRTLTVLGTPFVFRQSLRYGENPHQAADFYVEVNASPASMGGAKQLQGKELSYNNIQDADAALNILRALDDLGQAAVVAVKHMNPCGVGLGETVHEAFQNAYDADPVSIFGGIVACNRPVDGALAERLTSMFLEIVLAPSFTADARERFARKKNVRLLEVDMVQPLWRPEDRLYRRVSGGLLIQEVDRAAGGDWRVVTERAPSEAEWQALQFAWRVVKYVKSNAIVLATRTRTTGIGAGQMNRVGSARIAIEQAGPLARESVMASDAFFPMPDTVEAAAAAGVRAIVQPGGSIRDDDSIQAANRHGIAMVFTGERHFLH
ncbi:MAG: bifunctional phosphoribosylaminoimidazolecarboxamide formyltransferase/IMP cyclohydrolase [Alicyclobacillaceae bacterium]|nr:bifunctional phosphoribosylaminoimidazolecarboxamide formyltransferase/IMP cyclohydrolase [Alicyclobacillaceae bacterium]